MAKKELPTTKEDIEKALAEFRVRLHEIRFNSMGTKPKNVRETRQIKKDIARLETRKTALARASA